MAAYNPQLALKDFGKVPSPDYKKRDPEQSLLYQVIAKNLKTFLHLAESEGKRLPKHVVKEFDEYLHCGVLAYGFLRLKCEDCSHERLVAFSCKRRGICSSCGGRRMAETAAHLVDHVFPQVRVRQYVLSFPYPIRYLLARNSKIQSDCLTIVMRAITSYIKKKIKNEGDCDGKIRSQLECGAVTLIQRFGSFVNVNPHLHMMLIEGAYDVAAPTPKFCPAEAPTNEDIESLVKEIAHRVLRYLTRHSYFREDEGSHLTNEDCEDGELFPELQAASIQSKQVVGSNKGQRIRRLNSLGLVLTQPEQKIPLCAQHKGFSLHAGVYCEPTERDKLEKLARYVARPALSEQRMRLNNAGDILYHLKKPYNDGTTHLVFSPLEFMAKLSALVPQPRVHLARYHGILAPHSKHRSQVVPKPEPEAQPCSHLQAQQSQDEASQKTSPQSQRMSWARLLKRVFGIDAELCPNCGHKLKVISAIEDESVITKILTHLGLPPKPPDIAPISVPQQLAFE